MKRKRVGARTTPPAEGCVPHRHLVQSLVHLRGKRRLIRKQREWQAELRRGLRLHHVQRLARRIFVLLQNPVLHLRAAIGEDDPVLLVLNGGLCLHRRGH